MSFTYLLHSGNKIFLKIGRKKELFNKGYFLYTGKLKTNKKTSWKNESDRFGITAPGDCPILSSHEIRDGRISDFKSLFFVQKQLSHLTIDRFFQSTL